MSNSTETVKHTPWSVGEKDQVLCRRFNPIDWEDSQKGVDILDDVGDTVCIVLEDHHAPSIVLACNCFEALLAACEKAAALPSSAFANMDDYFAVHDAAMLAVHSAKGGA